MKTIIFAVFLVMIHGTVIIQARQPPANKMSHSGRIIKGDQGMIEYIQFIVHLRSDMENDSGTCGASVITYYHALTAAHCVYNTPATSITLYGNSTSRSRGGTVFYASKVVVHPDYNPNNVEYDVAIVQVRNSFQGYKNIVPIPLQNAEVRAGTWCYAAGWGLNNYDKETEPDKVQFAFLLTLSPEACSKAYPDLNTIICAQRKRGVDICQGDSGGPFVCNGKLTGASSFVVEGCRGEAPSGFAKIMHPSIRQFIRKHAGV